MASKDPKEKTVDITITTDTETAKAVLSAVEQLATDPTVDSSGIKHLDVKPTDWRDLNS